MAGAALLVFVGVLTRQPETDQLVAVVNDAQISRSEFDDYASVFVGPDGELRVTREQVLTSLINQELTAQEASRRGLTVGESDIDRAVALIDEINVEGLAAGAEGGQDAFRARVRAKLLMNEVKRVVAFVPDPDESVVRQAYDADPALHAVSFEEIQEELAGRIHRKLIEDRWIQWLARMRECSTIKVLDPTILVSYPHAEGACT